MHLVVRSGKFSVLATTEARNDFTIAIPSIDFLRSVCSNYSGSVNGYNSIFDRFAADGRLALTSAIMHEVNKNESLYELIKGDLRLMCFFSGGSLVLTNGVIKKGQKADKNAVAECKRAKDIFTSSLLSNGTR